MQQPTNPVLTADQVAAFDRDGFLVARGMASAARCRALVDEIDLCLDPPLGPLELEAETGYPGAPGGLGETGGGTPRRLLHAYSRGALFRDWARDPVLLQGLSLLFHGAPLALVQAHHNCIMTKFPRYGSQTGWHQDVRYWSFEAPDLVNAWLALGPEARERGGLRVIPGSHRQEFASERFDDALFFRPEPDDNRDLIEHAVDVELAPGDVLFFHCRLLHAAGRNLGDGVKRSLVFTYNRRDNPPLPGTRSARLPQVDV
jgi:phytanoyl-CoA hydroxylase